MTTSCAQKEVDAKIQALAYVVPESQRLNDFADRIRNYDLLAIGVYRVDHEGKVVRPQYSPASWQMMRQAPGALLALVALTNARAGSRMLSDPENRRRAIASLLQIARDDALEGIQIDFEYLTEHSAADFRTFLAELRTALTKHSKGLSVAAFPPLSGTPSEAAFFEPSTLHQHVDFIVYMTYDYHLKIPGPVTDLDWVQENLNLILPHVPQGKIFLGLPGYGYEWRSNRSRSTVSERQGRKLCQQYGCQRHRSGTLVVERSGSIAYFTDARLREDMTEIARTRKLAGTALWRIGFEN